MSGVKDYVVLINLGTPADTHLFTIQKYLFEFLFDPCVIDMPFISRLLLVGGIIVPTRSFNTRKSYQQIFTPEGSPLMIYSRKLAEGVQKLYSSCSQKFPGDSQDGATPKVVLAMRYGEPSMNRVFSEFSCDIDRGYRVRSVFIPLYPQAALSTTGTVVRKIEKLARRKKFENFNYRIAPPFYRDNRYLDILADSICSYLEREHDHILFSYHGIPERHLKKFDPGTHCLSQPHCCQMKGGEAKLSQQFCYRHQVYETTDMLAKRLKLKQSEYSLSFQSRLGKDPWLTPYTDQSIIELAKKGVKKLLVACPAFVSDNLETLFEIEIENEELFKKYGGERLSLIPCLNDREDWIGFLKDYGERYFPEG